MSTLRPIWDIFHIYRLFSAYFYTKIVKSNIFGELYSFQPVNLFEVTFLLNFYILKSILLIFSFSVTLYLLRQYFLKFLIQNFLTKINVKKFINLLLQKYYFFKIQIDSIKIKNNKDKQKYISNKLISFNILINAINNKLDILYSQIKTFFDELTCVFLRFFSLLIIYIIPFSSYAANTIRYVLFDLNYEGTFLNSNEAIKKLNIFYGLKKILFAFCLSCKKINLLFISAHEKLLILGKEVNLSQLNIYFFLLFFIIGRFRIIGFRKKFKEKILIHEVFAYQFSLCAYFILINQLFYGLLTSIHEFTLDTLILLKRKKLYSLVFEKTFENLISRNFFYIMFLITLINIIYFSLFGKNFHIWVFSDAADKDRNRSY